MTPSDIAAWARGGSSYAAYTQEPTIRLMQPETLSATAIPAPHGDPPGAPNLLPRHPHTHPHDVILYPLVLRVVQVVLDQEVHQQLPAHGPQHADLRHGGPREQEHDHQRHRGWKASAEAGESR